MTSTTDEITSLRAGLEDIARHCGHMASLDGLEPSEKRSWRAIARIAHATLKTPRASKVIPISAPRPVVKVDLDKLTSYMDIDAPEGTRRSIARYTHTREDGDNCSDFEVVHVNVDATSRVCARCGQPVRVTERAVFVLVNCQWVRQAKP